MSSHSSSRCKECGKRRDVMSACITLASSEDDTCAAGEKMRFDLGLTTLSRADFRMNKDASEVTFKTSGMYCIRFEGVIGVSSLASMSAHQRSIITVRFERSPDFSSDQRAFSTFDISPGDISRSTMLPFNSGDVLSIALRSANGRVVAIGKGCRCIIYRVGDV